MREWLTAGMGLSDEIVCAKSVVEFERKLDLAWSEKEFKYTVIIKLSKY